MDDVDVKRSSPPTPSPPRSIKRLRTDHHRPLPLTAPRGVERIPFSPSLNPNRLSSHYLAHLTSERTQILRGQGRRVVGLPVVLNDGIVLNWVRDALGGVNINDNAHQSTTSSMVHGNEKLSLPVVSTVGGSGTSAADAIAIDSDDEDVTRISGASVPDATVVEADCDLSGVSPRSCTDSPREPPIDRGAAAGKDMVNFSDSETELLSLVRPENKREDNPGGSHHPHLTVQAGSSDPIPSFPTSRRALTGGEDIVSLSGPRSDSTEVTTDSEVYITDEEAYGVEGVDASRVSAGQAVPSLQPIRQLLARMRPPNHSECDAPSQRTTVTPEASRELEGEGFLEEAPAITSSESEEMGCPASDPQLKRVPLPKTDYGRARRLLVPESANLPLVAVTMRGDCHFIERKKKYRISGYSLPNPGVFRHVGDVCMVGDTAVLGCDKGPHHISFLSVAGRPQMIDVTWSPHCSGPRYQDVQKRGVSRLAAIHAEGGHIKFLSGGYDGTIHEWMVGVEKLNEPRSRKVVSHGGSIMALAYRDRDRSVIASAQKKLHITDLNRCRTMTHLVSNDIQQIHTHPQAGHVTLLEVRHLDRQIQLYDSRKGNFDSEPCLSFGHRSRKGKFSGMHTRGSVHLVHFAMVHEDRKVLLWDFRNSKRAVIERQFRQAEKVVHTIFADSDIATFGQGIVTFFEDYLAQ